SLRCSSSSKKRMDLVIHAAHAAMAAMACRSGFFLFRHFSDEGLSSQEQSSDGSCILECSARDFLGVHNTGFHQVLISVGGNVVAFIAFALLDFLHDDRAFYAGILSQRAGWLFD